MAHEKLDAEFFFQQLYLARQRGLGHVQDACGAAEVPLVGQNDKVAKLPQIHFPGCPMWRIES